MNTTFLETQEDKRWIKEVFGIDMEADGCVCAILYGSQDSPEKIEFFKENRHGREPDKIWHPFRRDFLVRHEKHYSLIVRAKDEEEAIKRAFEKDLGEWQDGDSCTDVEEQ